MKKYKYLTALLINIATFAAQNAAKDFSLTSDIAYVDSDKDGLISLDEAYTIFDLYVNNSDHKLQNDLIKDVENTVIDLIGYLEGVSCSDVKGTSASKRFIELYYLNKFHPKSESNFGLPLGFSATDTTEKEVFIPIEKEQTAFFDRYFSVAAQLTSVTQQGFGIKIPNNLQEGATAITGDRESLVVASLPVSFNPWKNGVFNITPEYSGGNGVGNGIGFSGYPNALYGYPQTYPYLLRAQFQQSIQLTENKKALVSKIGFTLGKFVLQEVFDANPYSGDPKKDFLNFNHTMLSAWDAATTAYGFTYGGAGRVHFKNSQLNFALVTVNKEAGGNVPDWNLRQAHSINVQYVQNFSLGEKSGKIRALGFYNRAYTGNFSNFQVDSLGTNAYFNDSLKAYRGKYGFGADIDFPVTDDLGLFARYSWNDGHTESMGYTQADRAVNIGFTYAFARFHRPNDLLGVAASINELSPGHRNFLRNGGTGFMIGDGSLNYRDEVALEVFYRVNLIRYVDVGFNYQYIINSAYNYDRGNAHFLACRFNFEF
jgi:high affinity Mn2+ porin